jgi:hypothetical protein
MEDEMGEACNMDGEKLNVYRFLVRKPEGKRPLGRCRHRWEDNIKMNHINGTWWHKLHSSGPG